MASVIVGKEVVLQPDGNLTPKPQNPSFFKQLYIIKRLKSIKWNSLLLMAQVPSREVSCPSSRASSIQRLDSLTIDPTARVSTLSRDHSQRALNLRSKWCRLLLTLTSLSRELKMWSISPMIISHLPLTRIASSRLLPSLPKSTESLKW